MLSNVRFRTTAPTPKQKRPPAQAGGRFNHWCQSTKRLSARCHDHGHLLAFEAGFALNLRNGFKVAFDPHQEVDPQMLVRHFAATEAQGHFDLVAFFEEARHRAGFDVIIMIVDHRAELDFLQLNNLLTLARFILLFLFLEFEFSIIRIFAVFFFLTESLFIIHKKMIF